MITFQAEGAKKIASVVGKPGEAKTPLYWNPYKDKAKQIEVQDYAEFNTQEMRDRFMLSKDQASQIMDHLTKNIAFRLVQLFPKKKLN